MTYSKYLFITNQFYIDENGKSLQDISTKFNVVTINVYFNHFSIKDIPPTAFQDLHSLEWIKLYNNLLTTLHYELMEPVLDTLQHIDIHSKYCNGPKIIQSAVQYRIL